MDILSAVDTVEAMIRVQTSFENIEAFIDALPLGDMDKSALWLLAWGHATDRERREAVLEVMGT